MVNLDSYLNKGYQKLWGEHSLSLGEAVVFILGLVILGVKDRALLKNKWFIIFAVIAFVGMALF